MNKVKLYAAREQWVATFIRRLHLVLAVVVTAVSLPVCQAHSQQPSEQQQGIALDATSPEKRLSSGSEARSEAGYRVDRSEDMVQFWFWDIDRPGDTARILYSTSPSLPQGQSGEWTVNVYIVNVSSRGAVNQHRLYSKQAMEHVELALRRGHEEVFVQRNTDNPRDRTRLDVWSATHGTVLSSVAVPSPEGPNGERWDWAGFKTPTLDGNVLFTTNQRHKNAAGQTIATAAWFTLSPEGEIIGHGDYTLENARLMVRGWLPARGGRIGLAVDVSAIDESGVTSDIKSPIKREIGGRMVEAVVGREKRLLVTDASMRFVREQENCITEN